MSTIDVIQQPPALVQVVQGAASVVEVLTGPAGPAGPAGAAGPNAVAGYPFQVSDLTVGDHLEFAGALWVNVRRETLADGGNF